MSVHSKIRNEHIQSSKLIEEQTVNDKAAETFGLDRYFTIDGADLKNLFSCCYLTTRRVGADFVSGFFKFTYPAKRTNAIYFEFNMPSESFLDFSIKQLPSNMISPSNQSKIEMEKHNKEYGGKSGDNIESYLTNKYILVKDNANSDTTPEQVEF